MPFEWVVRETGSVCVIPAQGRVGAVFKRLQDLGRRGLMGLCPDVRGVFGSTGLLGEV